MWDRLSDKLGSILRREDAPSGARLDDSIENTDLQFQIARSVKPSAVKIAHDRLKMVEVEKEILSHAIQRLYEIEADGTISKDERDHLARRYKERMMQVKNIMQHDQSVLTLYNLECVQNELVEMFDKHLADLNHKIRRLRTNLDLKPVSTRSPKEATKTNRKKGGKRKKKRPRSKKKSEVKERIERIQAEVDKALGTLERIETMA